MNKENSDYQSLPTKLVRQSYDRLIFNFRLLAYRLFTQLHDNLGLFSVMAANLVGQRGSFLNSVTSQFKFTWNSQLFFPAPPLQLAHTRNSSSKHINKLLASVSV